MSKNKRKLKLIKEFRNFHIASGVILVIALYANVSALSDPVGQVVELRRCPKSTIPDPNNVTIPSNFRPKYDNEWVTFRTTDKPLKCPDSTRMVKETIRPTISKGVKASTATFLRTGHLVLNNELFDPKEYCISRIDPQSLKLRYCSLKCKTDKHNICITKCCGFGQVMKVGQRTECISPNSDSSNSKSDPNFSNTTDQDHFPLVPASPIYSKLNFTSEYSPILQLSSENILLRYRASLKPCKSNLLVVTKDYVDDLNDTVPAEVFRLLDNGSLALQAQDQDFWTPHSPGSFCIDTMVLENENEIDNGKMQWQMACIPSGEEEGNFETIVKILFTCLGILFLVFTMVIYLLIWDKHNIHGWTVFSFVVSMLVFFIALAWSHIVALTEDELVLCSGKCEFIAILVHFTFISTLCWMSVINFDLWATFKNLSPSKGRETSIRRYLGYSAFALGIPLLIIIISISLHYGVSPPCDINSAPTMPKTLPNYAHKFCRLHPESQFFYLYLPMGILLGFNFLMFSWTVWTLVRYKQKTQLAGGTSGPKQSLILFCKLFMVMGITWIMEFMSGIFEWEFILFDIINLLQAVFIFFIFAAKRENLLWIYRKYRVTQGIIRPVLRWRPCYVAEVDVEQTEMTSADRNKIDRNTVVSFRSRISSGSDNGY